MSIRTRPNKMHRQDIAHETQRLTPNIMSTTVGASSEAKLYHQLLPRIVRRSGGKPRITVQDQDTFTAARCILSTNSQVRVGILNMASEKNPGGGWLRGALAQEEALCLRSTLAATLNKEWYPLPSYGAIWSPKVAVFRDELENGYRVYNPEQRFIVGVVSLAALRRPALTKDKKQFANPNDVQVLKNKMRQIMRIIADNNISYCVLGAMGCGAFQNPPYEVARIYKEVLGEEEWDGVFEEIVFAVLDTRGSRIIGYSR
ncbi:hypothetical protein N7532_007176, partial [Penicillium argentinense]